jgi:hypothetical protein
MMKVNRITVPLAAMVASIAIYSSAFAEDNSICTASPESCRSGAIILVKEDKQIAMFCDFNKSIVNGTGAYICVRK